MEEIMDIIIRVVATLLALGLGYLLKLAANWIRSKLDDKQEAKFNDFLDELVHAAEQMYKGDDPGGSKRLSYVQNILIESGYELTDVVRALIESKVYDLNKWESPILLPAAED